MEPRLLHRSQRHGPDVRSAHGRGRVEGVEPTGEEPGDEALLLRAPAPVLERVFSGALSPLGAYTDGQLEVYGSQKDQIKLDVIALVLWGA